LTKSYWQTEFEDNAFLILKLKNDDVVATLHSTANQWKHKFLLEMTFEHGYINLDGILSSTRSYVPETLIVGRREFEDVTFAMGKPKESITYFEYDESWRLELEEFVEAIRGISPILNGTSNDALEIMMLTDSVYRDSQYQS
jgi:predicted dehydrogenase